MLKTEQFFCIRIYLFQPTSVKTIKKAKVTTNNELFKPYFKNVFTPGNNYFFTDF